MKRPECPNIMSVTDDSERVALWESYKMALVAYELWSASQEITAMVGSPGWLSACIRRIEEGNARAQMARDLDMPRLPVLMPGGEA